MQVYYANAVQYLIRNIYSYTNVLLRRKHIGHFIAVIFFTLCARNLEIIVGCLFVLFCLHS